MTIGPVFKIVMRDILWAARLKWPVIVPSPVLLFVSGFSPIITSIMRAAHSIVYIAGLVAVVAAEKSASLGLTWSVLSLAHRLSIELLSPLLQPYKVTPETTKRGAQFGFNICNSTTENQSSNCQTSFVNSLDGEWPQYEYTTCLTRR
jgi:hypothetical protein